MVNFLSTIVGISAFKFSQNADKATTDTGLERLHYRQYQFEGIHLSEDSICFRFTAGVLFLSVTLIGLTDIFGKQIRCHANKEYKDKNLDAVHQGGLTRRESMVSSESSVEPDWSFFSIILSSS